MVDFTKRRLFIDTSPITLNPLLKRPFKPGTPPIIALGAIELGKKVIVSLYVKLFTTKLFIVAVPPTLRFPFKLESPART